MNSETTISFNMLERFWLIFVRFGKEEYFRSAFPALHTLNRIQFDLRFLNDEVREGKSGYPVRNVGKRRRSWDERLHITLLVHYFCLV